MVLLALKVYAVLSVLIVFSSLYWSDDQHLGSPVVSRCFWRQSCIGWQGL